MAIRVHIPSPLYSYTKQKSLLDASGGSLRVILEDLDSRHKGLLFRIVDEQGGIRPHIKIYVNETPTRDLETPVASKDEVHIVAALSGG